MLTGFGPQPNLARLQGMNANMTGITVGSTEHFAAMNAFISEKRIAPVLDRVFAFDEVGRPMRTARRRTLGKIAIKIAQRYDNGSWCRLQEACVQPGEDGACDPSRSIRRRQPAR